jgi:ABC transport system ATP-binding/permease protein
VVTSTLVFEGNGAVSEYAGGYSDWVRQRPGGVGMWTSEDRPGGSPVKVVAKPAPAKEAARTATPPRKRKLTYAEQTELKALPDRIDALEQEREALYARLADPTTQRDASAVQAANTRLAQVDSEATAALARWEALETIASGG